jgi:hypothetical protein
LITHGKVRAVNLEDDSRGRWLVRLVLVLERKAATSRDQLIARVTGALPERSVVSLRAGKKGHEMLIISTSLSSGASHKAVSHVRDMAVEACEEVGRRVANVHEYVTECNGSAAPLHLPGRPPIAHRPRPRLAAEA